MEQKELQSFAANRDIEDSVRRGAGALDSSIPELRSELQSLRSDLNSLIDTVAKLVSHAGSEAGKSAREVTYNAAGEVSDLAGKGVEMASAATELAKTVASDLELMVRRNPVGAMAGAVIVGGLIGLMVRRR